MFTSFWMLDMICSRSSDSTWSRVTLPSARLRLELTTEESRDRATASDCTVWKNLSGSAIR